MAITKSMRCTSHPKYRGRVAPTIPCKDCAKIWKIVKSTREVFEMIQKEQAS